MDKNNDFPTSADDGSEKFILTDEMRKKLQDLPNILKYIEDLLHCVKKYRKKIKVLKSKVKVNI